ncbi:MULTISPECIES: DUF4468 domain-containing protein, partial [Bacteroidales]
SVLYANALQWASANDPKVKKKIEVQDGDNGSVVVKSELINNYSSDNSHTSYLTYKFRFSVKVDCKDAKYRYIISNPSVLVGADNNIETRYLPTSQLEAFLAELEMVESISKRHFQQILDWEVSNVYEVLEANSQELAKLKAQEQDPNTPKKERKRAGYRIEALNKENAILNEVLRRWIISLDDIAKGLMEVMRQNNDF